MNRKLRRIEELEKGEHHVREDNEQEVEEDIVVKKVGIKYEKMRSWSGIVEDRGVGER